MSLTLPSSWSDLRTSKAVGLFSTGSSAPARIEARSSHRMLTAQDAWTNMLRLTAAAVGAMYFEDGYVSSPIQTFGDAVKFISAKA